MEHDQPFRIVLIVGFALLVPVGGYYRLRSATREKLDRRQEGWFILLTLRPVAVLRMVGVIAFLIDPAWMAWSAFPLPIWLRWVGVGIGVLAGVLLTWTFHTLGRNLTDTVVARHDATLVMTGPYRWVRHPFYLAFALVVADSLATANGFLALTGVLLFLLLVRRTRKEEENLLERFGDHYRQYMARTGRFIPAWGRS